MVRARVARLGTLDERTRVHLVPVVFVVEGGTFYSPTDVGPRLAKRLRNLSGDPGVAILVDDYDEDWENVWWVRMRGAGRAVHDGPEREHGYRLLTGKYPQFAAGPPEAAGPLLAVDIGEWSGWAYRAE